jgi:hypothetical protein
MDGARRSLHAQNLIIRDLGNPNYHFLLQCSANCALELTLARENPLKN